MKRYDLLTPEGTRDLLFDECAARRIVEDRLRRIFTAYGYSEVITPGLEFYDVFNMKARFFAQESMYKLTDGKGRLMVMRPDSTMPIARVVSTRLRDEVFPLKLFYSQSVYRVNPKNSARDDEIFQSGIEIIGGDVRRSDIEALSIAVDVLKTCDADDFRFEIGDSAFFKILVSKLDCDEDEAEDIRVLVETKNYPALSEKLQKYGDVESVKALKALPSLFGGAEVFEQAEKIFTDSKTLDVLEDLRQVYNDMCSLGVADKLTVDLGMANKTDYYTGIVFKGYAEGYGMPVLSGGRYDTLLSDFGEDTPATGFGVNVNAAANALLKKQKNLMKKADVLVFAKDEHYTDSITHCRKLIEEGLIVDNAVIADFEEACEYAKAKGIKRIDVVGDEIDTINI